MHIVMMTYAVRSQKIILLRSFSSTYKLKRWQVWLSPYCVLKHLWRKRQQRGPRKVRVKLFDHLVTWRRSHRCPWMELGVGSAFYLMIRSDFLGSWHQMWAGHLVCKCSVCERSGECSRVFKGWPLWDSPGGPVAETLNSQYRVPRFHPWSGN